MIKMNFDERQGQCQKYDDLIKQSEQAVQKMMENSQKLNEALNMALQQDKL